MTITSLELARAATEQDPELSRELFALVATDPVLKGGLAAVTLLDATWTAERRLQLALSYGLLIGLRVGKNRADDARTKNPPTPGNLESTAEPVEKVVPAPPSE